MKVRLGDLTLIKTGKLDANASSPDGEYPFFTCSKDPLRISTYSYDCECVLVAGNGDLNVKYYNGKFNAYQRTYIIESINHNKLNVKFLYYFISDYLDILRENAIGGVIKYIKLGDLTNINIPLPPTDIQQKIVEEIEKIEKENTEKEQEINICRDKIKDISTTQAEYKKLEDFAIILKRGKSPKYSLEQTDIKILKSGQIRGLNNFDLSNTYYASQNMVVDERLLQKGDLLINSTGVGTAGRVNIFNLKDKYIVDSHVTILRLDKTKLLPLYALYQLYCNIGFKNIEKMATGQSGQIELAVQTIANIKIQVPPIHEQQKIVEKIEELEKQIERSSRNN